MKKSPAPARSNAKSFLYSLSFSVFLDSTLSSTGITTSFSVRSYAIITSHYRPLSLNECPWNICKVCWVNLAYDLGWACCDCHSVQERQHIIPWYLISKTVQGESPLHQPGLLQVSLSFVLGESCFRASYNIQLQ